MVIAALFGLGLAAAASAWCYRWNRSQQVLRVWGSGPANAVRAAERVELWRWQPPLAAHHPATAAERAPTPVPGQGLAAPGYRGELAAPRREITHAPGLVHVRHALLQPESLNWKALPGPTPNWQVALRFTHRGDTATLLLDFDSAQVLLLERKRLGSMTRIADGLSTFVQEQLAARDPLTPG
jgi:hypothetical protein